MGTWEPEGWNFSDSGVKLHVYDEDDDSESGGAQYALTAVLTTLLSIAVYMMISTVSTRVSKPAQPVYAISR
jgi:hypothetical protein